jgi:hypothetical protein
MVIFKACCVVFIYEIANCNIAVGGGSCNFHAVHFMVLKSMINFNSGEENVASVILGRMV